MHVPVIYHNINGNFFDGDEGWVGGPILKSSLGNLGFSETKCDTHSLIKGNNKGKAKCNAGLITELVDWGIVLGSENKLACKRNKNNFCSPILNDVKVKAQFNSECLGKTSCDLPKFDELMG
jgi:hypothetical protein